MKNNKQFKVIIIAVTLIMLSLAACKENKTDKTMKTQVNEVNTKAKKVLIIGMDPRTIDFTSPEIPKGLNVEIIEKGTQATLDKLKSLGYDAETFLIETGSNDLRNLKTQIVNEKYDGIVVGNGIRGLASNFILFEQIINVVHENAPQSKIIFNSLPTNTDEAVKRWL